jgi:hypothetical protein
MVDEAYGLGALRDAPDLRDYPLEALYAAEGIDPTPVAALPTSYSSPLMPPVLDQGATPQCVAFSSSSMKAWQDRRDQGQFFNFDEGTFFRRIGGGPDGAFVHMAMEELRTVGYPVVGSGDAARHKIAAYYAVPIEFAAIKAAIYDLGPVVISTTWYRSWFTPQSNGVLPAPNTAVGGHAIVAYGWDSRGLRLRNSWGAGWGPIGGDCFMPAARVAELWGAWKTVDAIEGPIAYSHTVRAIARPSLNVRSGPSTARPKVAALAYGKTVVTTRLDKYGGKYVANGRTRTDWLEVKITATKRGWIARGFTQLVK